MIERVSQFSDSKNWANFYDFFFTIMQFNQFHLHITIFKPLIEVQKKYSKKLILDNLDEKIKEYEKKMEQILSDKMKEDVSVPRFTFFKKLFNIPHVPKYLSYKEAYQYFNNYINVNDENWYSHLGVRKKFYALVYFKQDIEKEIDDEITLSSTQKEFLEAHDINYEISEIKNQGKVGK